MPMLANCLVQAGQLTLADADLSGAEDLHPAPRHIWEYIFNDDPEVSYPTEGPLYKLRKSLDEKYLSLGNAAARRFNNKVKNGAIDWLDARGPDLSDEPPEKMRKTDVRRGPKSFSPEKRQQKKAREDRAGADVVWNHIVPRYYPKQTDVLIRRKVMEQLTELSDDLQGKLLVKTNVKNVVRYLEQLVRDGRLKKLDKTRTPGKGAKGNRTKGYVRA